MRMLVIKAKDLRLVSGIQMRGTKELTPPSRCLLTLTCVTYTCVYTYNGMSSSLFLALVSIFHMFSKSNSLTSLSNIDLDIWSGLVSSRSTFTHGNGHHWWLWRAEAPLRTSFRQMHSRPGDRQGTSLPSYCSTALYSKATTENEVRGGSEDSDII